MNELPTGPAAGDSAIPVPASVPEERFPFWTYQDVAVLAGLALPALILATIIVEGVSHALTNAAPGQTPQLLAAQFVGYAFLLLALYALLRLRYDRPFWRSMGWVMPEQGMLLSAVVWGPLVAVGISLLGVVLRTPEMDMPINDPSFAREAAFALLEFLHSPRNQPKWEH